MMSSGVLNKVLTKMFEFSPVAICICTVEPEPRYVKVNPAYLRLVGRCREELENQSIIHEINTPLSDSRKQGLLHLLDTVGYFEQQVIELRHSCGKLISVRAAGHRCVIDGQIFDVAAILDNTEQKNYEMAILEMAYTDMLTGLPNRACFENYLNNKIENTAPDKGIVLAFLDLNDFKIINDTFGHSVGDKVLSVVGKRLKNKARQTGMAARLGGDEFCYMFETDSFSEERVTSDFIRLGSYLTRKIEIDHACITVGVSVGVVISPGKISADLLLKNADQLMYKAKAGKNMVDVRCAFARRKP